MKKKLKISNGDISYNLGLFNMITKDLLTIGGHNVINIINVNSYELINEIYLPNCDKIYGFCMLNENMFLAGGYGKILQWKIEGNNIILFSEKDEDYGEITFSKIGNGKIAFSCLRNSIKIY